MLKHIYGISRARCNPACTQAQLHVLAKHRSVCVCACVAVCVSVHYTLTSHTGTTARTGQTQKCVCRRGCSCVSTLYFHQPHRHRYTPSSQAHRIAGPAPIQPLAHYMHTLDTTCQSLVIVIPVLIPLSTRQLCPYVSACKSTLD